MKFQHKIPINNKKKRMEPIFLIFAHPLARSATWRRQAPGGWAHFAKAHVIASPHSTDPTKIVWSPKNNGLLLALFVNILLFSLSSHLYY